MKSETLSFKAVISELDFFKEQLIFNETSKEKDLKLFATKLTETILIFTMLKNTIYHFLKRKIQNQ